MRPTAFVALLPLALVAVVAAEASPGPDRRVYQTGRAASPPELDGRLDDGAWQSVAWAGDFVQHEPAEGIAPSRQTQFKVLFDDDALYFAFRAFDDPALLSRHLARRDRFPGDWIEVNIDSYFDHRTAFSFTLSLSGTRGDEFVSDDGNTWDPNWDPIWQAATCVDDEGWTAEMRIPLSQLRFSGEPSQTWGLQVQRRIFRQEERSTWQPIPKAGTGWVSRFGELRGIGGIKPHRRLELLPYSVGRVERREQEQGNPFRDGSSAELTAGVDGKLGVGSNLTMDFTLNPDFGQVEADPSEVNLTAFETFFPEKRPFFVEGSNIFALRLAPAVSGGHFSSDRLFYSRRIGAPPPHTPELGSGEFAHTPDQTSILGAFKVSGKTPGGLAIGVLESVTGRERAQVSALGLRRDENAAPLTNWFVGRLQQDLRGGDTQLGLMFTSVLRDDARGPLGFLPSQAYSGGFDFAHYLGQRAFLIEGNLLASQLRGSREAIEEVQTASAHYFQRPDNDHARLDLTRTALGGHAGSLRVRRTANSPIRFQAGAAWRSPGFELNDIGFMNRADEINQFGWGAYQRRNPFSIFRRMELNVNEWVDWDFGGALLRRAVNGNGNAHFRNNWQIGGSVTREAESRSNDALRGGPASRWPGFWSYEVWLNSDTRKPLSVNVGTNQTRGDEASRRERQLWADVTYRPTGAFTVTLSPSLRRNQPELQYVDTQPAFGQQRYLFGSLDQKTLSLTLRLDLSITPNLTIQYYGAPFVSTGRYSQLKRIVAPLAAAYRDRFATFTPAQLTSDAAASVYRVDENQDGAVDYTFDRPDFDFREFNSTLVARWEYRPGSQLYVVWSQNRLDEALRADDLGFRRGVSQLFETHPHDVFLVKFSRWFSF